MPEKEKRAGKKPDKELNSCPRCGRPMKLMRCRIDASEMYCPGCGHFFDPRVLKKRHSE